MGDGKKDQSPFLDADVRIHLERGNTLRGGAGRQKGRRMMKGFEQLARRMSPKVREELLAIEDRVLAFVDEKKENAVAFTTDPLGTARRLGLSDEAVAELRVIRAATANATPDIPGIRFRTITVDAKGARR